MRIALIADVHSNIIALEAVMKAIKKHSPDRIISLGDQVNLGPCPRETMDMLKAENVVCLHGNHERYILSAMDGHPGYAGANFNTLRYNASRLSRDEITLPKVMELDGVTFCHAMPEDDRFPVFEVDQAIPMLEKMTFDKPTHIICGHGHNPTHLSLPNFTLDSIGSVGCMDDGVPGTAPFAILTIHNGHTGLRPYYVGYNAAAMKDLYKKSGMADFCPIMAHITCLQMMTNNDYLVGFVAKATALSKSRGEPAISEETWKDMDRAFPWPDGVGTAEFWK